MELHGGWSKPKSFEHTVYITGQWVLPDMYRRNIAKGRDSHGKHAQFDFRCQNCDAKTLIAHTALCTTYPSWATLSGVGNATRPWGLHTFESPYSPPPMDPATAAQFNTLLGGMDTGSRLFRP